MNWKRGHFQYWLEALQTKYEGRGKPYGPEDFKKILADYDVSSFLVLVSFSRPSLTLKVWPKDFHKRAVTDIPSILFVDELLTTYPNAKVVLTTRDVDKWLVSMDRSFYTILGWPTFDLLAMLDRIGIVSPYPPRPTSSHRLNLH